jgi:hypothetical protein
MPDISMCRNKECPLRSKCYRFLATPSFWQAYIDAKPITKEDGTVVCEHFYKADISK